MTFCLVSILIDGLFGHLPRILKQKDTEIWFRKTSGDICHQLKVYYNVAAAPFKQSSERQRENDFSVEDQMERCVLVNEQRLMDNLCEES